MVDQHEDYAALANFGQSFAESEPKGLPKIRIMLRAGTVLGRRLGGMAVARLLLRAPLLAAKVDLGALVELRERGLEDLRFLAARVDETTLAAAVVEQIGHDRAAKLYREILEEVADDVMGELVPTAAALAACGDAFSALRAYLKAAAAANAAAGIHHCEIRDDREDVFAYDVVYCAYERVAAAYGDSRLCDIANCTGDDVSFPRLCRKIGARFSRTSTLARGARCCDFRFERVAT